MSIPLNILELGYSRRSIDEYVKLYPRLHESLAKLDNDKSNSSIPMKPCSTL
jgi:hypothetical protein